MYNRQGQWKTIEMNVPPQFKERINIIDGVEGYDYKKYEPRDSRTVDADCGDTGRADRDDETKE